MVRVLITAPKRIRAGEAFEVKLLIGHPMESGQRRDAMGQAIPREIIHSLTATMAGQEVFQASFYPAIAANPYLSFRVQSARGGELVIRFTDDLGVTQTEAVSIAVDAAA